MEAEFHQRVQDYFRSASYTQTTAKLKPKPSPVPILHTQIQQQSTFVLTITNVLSSFQPLSC